MADEPRNIQRIATKMWLQCKRRQLNRSKPQPSRKQECLARSVRRLARSVRRLACGPPRRTSHPPTNPRQRTWPRGRHHRMGRHPGAMVLSWGQALRRVVFKVNPRVAFQDLPRAVFKGRVAPAKEPQPPHRRRQQELGEREERPRRRHRPGMGPTSLQNLVLGQRGTVRRHPRNQSRTRTAIQDAASCM